MKEFKMLPNGRLGEIQDPTVLKQQLQELIMQWYQWLSSNPEPLFNDKNIEQMIKPVGFFQESMDWLSRTTFINAKWFFDSGSDHVMTRWLKDDYDAY